MNQRTLGTTFGKILEAKEFPGTEALRGITGNPQVRAMANGVVDVPK